MHGQLELTCLTPRSELAGTAINEKIYIIGGFNNEGKTSDTVEFYDTKTNVWSKASPLPIHDSSDPYFHYF